MTTAEQERERGMFGSLNGSFNSVPVVQVEPGTEIEHDGQKIAVTDDCFVTKGRTIYVTPKNYKALLAKLPSA